MSSRVAVRTAVLDVLPSAVDDVIADIRHQIPAYDTLSVDQLREVSAIASWGIGRVLDLWVADLDLNAADIDRFRGIGAARALDGRPLPSVLRAYRLAGKTITAMVTRVGGDSLTVTDAMALANLWMATIDSLSEALYTGHGEASGRIVDDREQALADLLGDLLTGRQVTLTALADRSRQLGITLPSQPCVLVVETVGPGELTTLTLDRLLSASGLASNESVLRAIEGPRATVVAHRGDIATITADLPGLGLRGCAVQASRTNDLNRADQLAELCLDLAPDHAFANRPVLDEGDAQVLALLTANPHANPGRALECILQGVTEDANAHILDGLDAFLAHGSASSAAQRLDLHPQTMRYRLRRLHEITGRDVRRPWDRFVLGAARQCGANRLDPI